LPARTVPEFIAHAKAYPAKLNIASAGSGSGIHLAGELFKLMTAVDMTPVPYRGSAPALIDLLAGQVQVMFTSVSSSLAHLRTGALRPLAVTTAARSEVLPELPTVGEFVTGYEASGWYGIGAPQGIPSRVIDKLHREINAGLADSGVMARLKELGGSPMLGPPADFATLIADEVDKWGKVIRAGNIKAQ
jgi:tripartite-type tricarboxylate transporter receptor subunit TctC